KFFDGSLARIDRVPADLRARYATAFEVEPVWLVEAAARRQKWIDQAQSLNIYIAGASGKTLHDVYMLAWLRGLKTTYYLRSLGATGAEKSTTVRIGQPNAVISGAFSSGSVDPGASHPVAAAEALGAEFCSLDDPECEACQ
ncbi:MAG: ribonucleoside-diphosphate reductase subunit alpha, partial [Gammaproteobacteria bacterium]